MALKRKGRNPKSKRPRYIDKEICDRFTTLVHFWQSKFIVSFGGYGSGKSYHIAIKIILKLMLEKRTCVVVRNIYASLGDSCVSLLIDVLKSMNFYSSASRPNKYKAIYKKSPHEIIFPNGSRIIFKGMDGSNYERLKSIHDVSIVWVEEANEIPYIAFKELVGRLRSNKWSLHFILSFNPISMQSWVYKHFFVHTDDDNVETLIQSPDEVYEKKDVYNPSNDTYYHHSTVMDNKFISRSYIKSLDDLWTYDKEMYRIARLGHFGVTGLRVLPQFEIATSPLQFTSAINALPKACHKFGFDFGFETSFNAVVSVAVDSYNSTLYIYDEIYINKVTDDIFCNNPKMQEHRRLKHQLVADSEDPKAIQYYSQQGFTIRPTMAKFQGSRLSNTRKIKRFKRIVCSPLCKNTIKELRYLTYKVDKDQNIIYDEFNIDAHTLSALWYALDTVTVADPKNGHKRYQRANLDKPYFKGV